MSTRAEWRAAEERAVITAIHLAKTPTRGRSKQRKASKILVGEMAQFEDGFSRVIAAWHAQGLTHLISINRSMLVYDTDMISVRG